MDTTLNQIKEQSPCKDGWKKLLKYLGKSQGDDEPLGFEVILDSNGIRDAVWCLRVLPYKDRCLFAAEVAESVLNIFESKHPGDDRPRKAIEAVRMWHRGGISDEELQEAAHAAAYAAFADAYAARAAAYAAFADADADAAAYAAADAAADADAREAKWGEIEALFVNHFCGTE